MMRVEIYHRICEKIESFDRICYSLFPTRRNFIYFESTMTSLNDSPSSLPYSLGMSFVSQVMLFFGLAILSSAFGAYSALHFFASVFLANPELIWFVYLLELVLVFTSRLWSTRMPLNYVLFFLFTFSTGVTLVPLLASVIYEFGSLDIIYKALLATTLMFGATALFGWVTRINLQGMSGFLWMSLLGMIVVSIIHIFMPWGSFFELLFAGFGVIVFSGFTMYDIQNLKVYPHDRAIDAALNLYLDIFNLFIFIVRLLTGSRR